MKKRTVFLLFLNGFALLQLVKAGRGFGETCKPKLHQPESRKQHYADVKYFENNGTFKDGDTQSNGCQQGKGKCYREKRQLSPHHHLSHNTFNHPYSYTTVSSSSSIPSSLHYSAIFSSNKAEKKKFQSAQNSITNRMNHPTAASLSILRKIKVANAVKNSAKATSRRDEKIAERKLHKEEENQKSRRTRKRRDAKGKGTAAEAAKQLSQSATTATATSQNSSRLVTSGTMNNFLPKTNLAVNNILHNFLVKVKQLLFVGEERRSSKEEQATIVNHHSDSVIMNENKENHPSKLKPKIKEGRSFNETKSFNAHNAHHQHQHHYQEDEDDATAADELVGIDKALVESESEEVHKLLLFTPFLTRNYYWTTGNLMRIAKLKLSEKNNSQKKHQKQKKKKKKNKEERRWDKDGAKQVMDLKLTDNEHNNDRYRLERMSAKSDYEKKDKNVKNNIKEEAAEGVLSSTSRINHEIPYNSSTNNTMHVSPSSALNEGNLDGIAQLPESISPTDMTFTFSFNNTVQPIPYVLLLAKSSLIAEITSSVRFDKSAKPITILPTLDLNRFLLQEMTIHIKDILKNSPSFHSRCSNQLRELLILKCMMDNKTSRIIPRKFQSSSHSTAEFSNHFINRNGKYYDEDGDNDDEKRLHLQISINISNNNSKEKSLLKDGIIKTQKRDQGNSTNDDEVLKWKIARSLLDSLNGEEKIIIAIYVVSNSSLLRGSSPSPCHFEMKLGKSIRKTLEHENNVDIFKRLVENINKNNHFKTNPSIKAENEDEFKTWLVKALLSLDMDCITANLFKNLVSKPPIPPSRSLGDFLLNPPTHQQQRHFLIHFTINNPFEKPQKRERDLALHKGIMKKRSSPHAAAGIQRAANMKVRETEHHKKFQTRFPSPVNNNQVGNEGMPNLQQFSTPPSLSSDSDDMKKGSGNIIGYEKEKSGLNKIISSSSLPSSVASKWRTNMMSDQSQVKMGTFPSPSSILLLKEENVGQRHGQAEERKALSNKLRRILKGTVTHSEKVKLISPSMSIYNNREGNRNRRSLHLNWKMQQQHKNYNKINAATTATRKMKRSIDIDVVDVPTNSNSKNKSKSQIILSNSSSSSSSAYKLTKGNFTTTNITPTPTTFTGISKTVMTVIQQRKEKPQPQGQEEDKGLNSVPREMLLLLEEDLQQQHHHHHASEMALDAEKAAAAAGKVEVESSSTEETSTETAASLPRMEKPHNNKNFSKDASTTNTKSNFRGNPSTSMEKGFSKRFSSFAALTLSLAVAAANDSDSVKVDSTSDIVSSSSLNLHHFVSSTSPPNVEMLNEEAKIETETTSSSSSSVFTPTITTIKIEAELSKTTNGGGDNDHDDDQMKEAKEFSTPSLDNSNPKQAAELTTADAADAMTMPPTTDMVSSTASSYATTVPPTIITTESLGQSETPELLSPSSSTPPPTSTTVSGEEVTLKITTEGATEDISRTELMSTSASATTTTTPSFVVTTSDISTTSSGSSSVQNELNDPQGTGTTTMATPATTTTSAETTTQDSGITSITTSVVTEEEKMPSTTSSSFTPSSGNNNGETSSSTSSEGPIMNDDNNNVADGVVAEQDEQCDQGTGLECSEAEKRCICKEGRYFHPEKKRCINFLGSSCLAGEMSGSDSNSNSNKNGNDYAGVGESQCPLNSECIKNEGQQMVCKCVKGFSPTKDLMECLPGLKRLCSSSSSSQCHPDFDCKEVNGENRCVCKANQTLGIGQALEWKYFSEMENGNVVDDDSVECMLDYGSDCDPLHDKCNNFRFLKCSNHSKKCECGDKETQLYYGFTRECVARVGTFCTLPSNGTEDDKESKENDGKGSKNDGKDLMNPSCIDNSTCVPIPEGEKGNETGNNSKEGKSGSGGSSGERNISSALTMLTGTCQCNPMYGPHWAGYCIPRNGGNSIPRLSVLFTKICTLSFITISQFTF